MNQCGIIFKQKHRSGSCLMVLFQRLEDIRSEVSAMHSVIFLWIQNHHWNQCLNSVQKEGGMLKRCRENGKCRFFFFYAEHIRVRTKSRFSLGAKEKMYIRVGSSGLLCHVYQNIRRTRTFTDAEKLYLLCVCTPMRLDGRSIIHCFIVY